MREQFVPGLQATGKLPELTGLPLFNNTTTAPPRYPAPASKPWKFRTFRSLLQALQYFQKWKTLTCYFSLLPQLDTKPLTPPGMAAPPAAPPGLASKPTPGLSHDIFATRWVQIWAIYQKYYRPAAPSSIENTQRPTKAFDPFDFDSFKSSRPPVMSNGLTSARHTQRRPDPFEQNFRQAPPEWIFKFFGFWWILAKILTLT